MISWVEARWPYGDRVRALTTARDGGRSAGTFAGLNLATHVGDDPGAVRANRSQLAELLGGLPTQWLEQVHGTTVMRASGETTATVPVADGAWSDTPGLVLSVLTADCLPVVLVDGQCRNLAVIHAGWRGLVAGVLASACSAMRFRPQAAWLGPAIGPEAYEVGTDVLEAVARLPVRITEVTRPAPWPDRSDRGFLDLFALAEVLLQREGVSEVYSDRLSTYTDPRFYSYRRDGVTGRMATLAWLRH